MQNYQYRRTTHKHLHQSLFHTVTLLSLTLLLSACTNEIFSEQSSLHNAKQQSTQLKQPNILWLVLEDMSPILEAYGDHTVKTPNITRLAKEGVKYTQVYSPSGVCAPSRAALATGMYPSAIGANNMRTWTYTHVTGLPKYEAVPPAEVKMLSHYMRLQGYYTTNNSKTDYQFKPPKTAWDQGGVLGHWRSRPNKNQPFFSIMNFTTTHESGLFEPYGIRHIEQRHYIAGQTQKITALNNMRNPKKGSEAEAPVHLPKDTKFTTIPPYLPDTPLVQRDFWKMYNNLAEADSQIGAVLADLEEDGLLDSTIIVFYTDHGGPLPRQKRLIYDSGLKVPLIIRYPDGRYAGMTDDQLVSFIDFAPTTLAMVGADVPKHMHGQNFINNGDKKRQYIHAAADRFDADGDVIRAVKDKRYKYIRNYLPEKPYYLKLSYREKIPTMQELLRLRDAGQLTKAQALWFRTSKPREELFDTWNDPHEINDIAGDPQYAEKIKELSTEMDRWLAEIGDTPDYPERQMITDMWNGGDSQPVTEAPEISLKHGMVSITSKTDGASIGYKIIQQSGKPSKSWTIYQKPFALPQGAKLEVFAHRIGYLQSDVISN
ncbi:sulfatase family protein [Algibacillus agarilyticus]|uniref:sulfatase family protein n=1 Tax=Algibacillus agarilyticus TaxID=2234133 RepID=UPI000DCF6520|nr:sulfatase [Algibacillus agarilyticus]